VASTPTQVAANLSESGHGEVVDVAPAEVFNRCDQKGEDGNLGQPEESVDVVSEEGTKDIGAFARRYAALSSEERNQVDRRRRQQEKIRRAAKAL
jgi:hypothetical protein